MLVLLLRLNAGLPNGSCPLFIWLLPALIFNEEFLGMLPHLFCNLCGKKFATVPHQVQVYLLYT